MKPLNATVFRAYDVRGLVGEDFDPDWVETLGLACGVWFAERGYGRAAVAFDVRHSSPEYAARVVRGLTRAGVDAVVLGMVPTPAFYYACVRLGLPAGIMVTASHNPPEYNGFKLWGGETALMPDEIAGVRETMGRIMENPPADAPSPGLVSEHVILPAYLDEIASLVRLARPIKVVVDGGNGAAGEVAAEALERCGAEVVRLYTEPDGDFPNHHPDPVVERYAADLKARVKAERADLGVGLDGDGDRIGLVDETGRLMVGDELTAIVARDILANNPGGLILGDVKCSHRLFNDIEAHGGRARMAATGHSLMKAEVKRSGALLAGEVSGHLYFGPPWIGTDDAVFAACRLAEILSRAGTTMSGLLTDWPPAESTPEIRADCPPEWPEAVRFAVVEKLAAEFAERAESEGFTVSDVDGARLTWPDGWGLIRPSNTQPVLVMRFEAATPERLVEIRALMEGALAAALAHVADETGARRAL